MYQIDHTLIDVIVIDSEHRKPIGRPWLTVVMDVRTRMVVGFWVGLEPPDPADGRSSVLGEDWLAARYRHARIAQWAQVFRHAARDLLFILTTDLRRETVLALGERSVAWPADLRRRWTYAAAIGAVGGYVF
jgi:transposase InsO family protein